jgi:HAD superfamily hydrolase (TIGR01509 family)
MAEEIGKQLPERFFAETFGMKNETIFTRYLGWTSEKETLDRYARLKENLYRKVVREDGIRTLPGVEKFLRVLKSEGIPCAVASSGPRENIQCAMEMIAFEKYFETIVSSEDVSHGKPDPEVFLLTADRLKVKPERCVVFEDSHVGIEAAKAAGTKVVAVTSTHAPESLSDADRVIDSFEELSAEEISDWFG